MYFHVFIDVIIIIYYKPTTASTEFIWIPSISDISTRNTRPGHVDSASFALSTSTQYHLIFKGKLSHSFSFLSKNIVMEDYVLTLNYLDFSVSAIQPFALIVIPVIIALVRGFQGHILFPFFFFCGLRRKEQHQQRPLKPARAPSAWGTSPVFLYHSALSPMGRFLVIS